MTGIEIGLDFFPGVTVHNRDNVVAVILQCLQVTVIVLLPLGGEVAVEVENIIKAISKHLQESPIACEVDPITSASLFGEVHGERAGIQNEAVDVVGIIKQEPGDALVPQAVRDENVHLCFREQLEIIQEVIRGEA